MAGVGVTGFDNIVDPGLAEHGLRKIDWARQFMPALAAARSDSGSSLLGRRVGVVLTLEPKTANLALALAESGASVSVFCSGSHTFDDVASALASKGVRVFARSDADEQMDSVLLDRFLDDSIEFLIDDGASVIRRAHTDRRDVLGHLLGAAEETTSGVRPLRVMEAEGALEIPCLAVNDALTKQLFDNVYGTGQSVVMTLLDVTNTQLQGKRVVVVGYGYVGKGIASVARALGARVSVTEVDPVRALQAVHDGYQVARLEDLAAVGDVFITASGVGYSLVSDHIRAMRDGTLLIVGGAGPPEISVEGEAPLVRGDFVRADVRSIPLDGGSTVFLVADGECANVAAAEGNPIEIMDLSLAVQFRSIDYLVVNHQSLPLGVHDVPESIDDLVARSALAAMGADLDAVSQRQAEHAASWRVD